MQSFTDWMRAVDKILESKVGFGSSHLEDFCWRDNYEDGTPPDEAVDYFFEENPIEDYIDHGDGWEDFPDYDVGPSCIGGDYWRDPDSGEMRLG